jgi:hypothetical protein
MNIDDSHPPVILFCIGFSARFRDRVIPDLCGPQAAWEIVKVAFSAASRKARSRTGIAVSLSQLSAPFASFLAIPGWIEVSDEFICGIQGGMFQTPQP